MRNLNLIAATATLALLAACAPANRSVESVKTPEIQTALLSFDVRFAGGTELPAADRQALEQYLDSIRMRYGDRISLDDPAADGAAARRKAIAAVVARYGLFLEAAAPVTTGALAPGSTRIVVARGRLDVASCPDWRRRSNPEFQASSMSNYGCASRGNLAAMIADPNDLTTPRTYGGTDAMTATKPVKTLRDRVAKPPESLAGLSDPRVGATK